jgi:hypothetical protein
LALLDASQYKLLFNFIGLSAIFAKQLEPQLCRTSICGVDQPMILLG